MSPGRMSTLAEMSPRFTGPGRARCTACPFSRRVEIALLPSAKSVRPRPRSSRRAGSMRRKARICGFVASPTTRICSLAGPTKESRQRSRRVANYFPSAFSMSRRESSASCRAPAGRRQEAWSPCRPADRDQHRQFRIAPDDDVDGVERTDQYRSRPTALAGRRRVGRARAGGDGQRDQSGEGGAVRLRVAHAAKVIDIRDMLPPRNTTKADDVNTPNAERLGPAVSNKLMPASS